MEHQGGAMKKNHNRQRRDRAEAKVKAHPMFPRLLKAFEGEPSVERAELVHQVCAEHNSARTVARAVKFDLGTIRRDLRIAALPPADKNRIRGGDTATQVLADAERHVNEERWQRQLEAERATRKESDKLKGLIISWVGNADLAGSDVVKLLNDADGIVHEWHKEGKLAGRLPSRSTPDAVIAEQTRKAKLANFGDAIPGYYPNLLCLVNWVVRLAPDWSILEPALVQARIHFEGLRECCVPKSPQERMEDILNNMREDEERRRMVRSLGAESMRDPRSRPSPPPSAKGQKDCEEQRSSAMVPPPTAAADSHALPTTTTPDRS
jgi:hypothetical protein